jgi:hypothetical protein
MKALFIFIGIFVAGLVHFLILKSGIVPAGKTESNYFSNRARLQHASAITEPEVTFVGSSITGRLPCQDDKSLMNLGFDGGSSLEGLRALKDGQFRCGKVCFIEVNRLISAFDASENVRISWLDQVSHVIPNLKSDNRPSSLMYRSLLQMRDRKQPLVASRDVVILPWEKPLAIIDQPESRNRAIKFQEISEIIRALADRTRVILVFYPVGYTSIDWPAGSPDDGKALAASLSLEFIDLHEMTFNPPLQFSDSTHLDEASAVYVRDCLIASLQEK